MGIMKKPHDKFFKETLSDLETTRDFMRNYLPADLLAVLNLEELIPQKDSYIEKELEEAFSDLLFKVRINGEEGFIYFLFEHKSYLSDKVTLQLLKYMLKIWEQKTKKENASKLPIIIPLVFYHGETKWNVAKRLGDSIEGIEKLPETLKRFIPDYEYLLYDLSPYGAEEIKGNAKLRIFLQLLRSIFAEDSEEFMDTFKQALITLEELDRLEKGIDYFETLVRYIMNARSDLNIVDMYDVVKTISLERSEEIMTIAEQLMKEGMEKGRIQGIEQGIERGIKKGILEGKRGTAKNLLKLGLAPEQVAEAAELSMEEVMQLKKEIEAKH